MSEGGVYTARNQVRVALMEERRNAYKILVGKPDWKRPIGIPKRRFEDNFRMILETSGGKLSPGFIWITLGTRGGGGLVNTIMNLRVSQKAGNFFIS
jgi:hypothetical protein